MTKKIFWSLTLGALAFCAILQILGSEACPFARSWRCNARSYRSTKSDRGRTTVTRNR